jgi:uncharacterized repeat protein (TIGR03803 family)
VLHSFGNETDGRNPTAGLIKVGGTLCGTTEFGGKHNRGTVFSITTGGAEKVLHSFGKAADGSQPLAQLIYVSGMLYGTTSEGGAHACGRYRCGTVFSVTTRGMEKVLHSFNGTDGQGPAAGLVDANGTLYGTTSKGGAYTCAGGKNPEKPYNFNLEVTAKWTPNQPCPREYSSGLERAVFIVNGSLKHGQITRLAAGSSRAFGKHRWAYAARIDIRSQTSA